MKRKDLLLLANKWINKSEQNKTIRANKTIRTNYNVDIKLVITEHRKTSRKLPKTMRQDEKVDSNNSLYSHTKKNENILNKKT